MTWRWKNTASRRKNMRRWKNNMKKTKKHDNNDEDTQSSRRRFSSSIFFSQELSKAQIFSLISIFLRSRNNSENFGKFFENPRQSLRSFGEARASSWSSLSKMIVFMTKIPLEIFLVMFFVCLHQPAFMFSLVTRERVTKKNRFLCCLHISCAQTDWLWKIIENWVFVKLLINFHEKFLKTSDSQRKVENFDLNF